MSDKDLPIPSTPDPISLLTKAGKLNYSTDQAVAIVCSLHADQNKDTLQQQITTPGTKEYNAYHDGQNIGMFDVESGLHDSAAGGDADAQKALQNLRVERTVGAAIKEKFFPK